jgi:dolichyl-phosphate-mannose-protein mannosyltransferase
MANRAPKSPARQTNNTKVIPTSKGVSKPTGFASEGVGNYDVTTLESDDWMVCGALSVVALFVRLFRISQPTSVVFDEVQYVSFPSSESE